MKSILILVSSSPNTQNTIRALRLASAFNERGNKVSVFLLQDGVYYALSKQNPDAKAAVEKAMAAGIDIYVMDEDLISKGFRREDLTSRIQVSDYSGLIELMMEKHDSVIGAF